MSSRFEDSFAALHMAAAKVCHLSARYPETILGAASTAERICSLARTFPSPRPSFSIAVLYRRWKHGAPIFCHPRHSTTSALPRSYGAAARSIRWIWSVKTLGPFQHEMSSQLRRSTTERTPALRISMISPACGGGAWPSATALTADHRAAVTRPVTPRYLACALLDQTLQIV